MTKPTIFVTNDDGIQSPGLLAAVKAAMPLGDVLIAAPSRQQTGMSRCLYGNKEARLVAIDYVVNGRSLLAYHCDVTNLAI